MKKIYIMPIFTFILLSVVMNVNAQFDERMERLQAQKVAYFTERMKLTSTEAEKFWPVYNDFSNRKEKLEEESRSALRFLAKNSGNMAETEINESLARYIGFQDKIHTLFNEYHLKYLEILPAQKVAMIYITETHFRSYLLNQIRDVRQDRNPRRF